MAGSATSQRAAGPPRKASSVVTRIEVAPNQEAVSERAASGPETRREARKKSSKPLIRRRAAKPAARTAAA